MLKQMFKWTMLAAGLALIAACSSSHKAGMSGNGVDASGLGIDSRFPGSHAGEVNPATGEKYNTIYFGYDSDTIPDRYMPVIQANVTYLKSHANAKVRLEGHTDPRGSREYNIGLGQRRGNSVADALEAMGIARSQFIVVSYGKEKLAVPGHSEEDYRLDRRVEIIYEAN